MGYIFSFLATTNGWETPSPHQYHIQTDEGPERYFRYETDSGQYRKEKRLEDGTIIGTYAWIDADGILRQRDYIADGGGYRILRSKNVFVGRNLNVGAAVKAVKKYPGSAGTLVKSNQRPVITVPYDAVIPTSYLHSTTSPNVLSTTTIKPYFDATQNSYVSSTSAITVASSTTESPIVEITPHSYVGSTSARPTLILDHSVNVSSLTETYVPSTATTSSQYYDSTLAPIPYRPYRPAAPTSTHSPAQFIRPSSTFEYVSTPKPQYDSVPQIYSTDIDQNSLDYNNPYVHQGDQGYRFQNGPTYPIDRSGKPYNGIDREAQQNNYDGVSVTNDGFRYYIPRAYHEEQTLPDDKRSGSFGYIDPFGIRRVIYYNTAPGTGFQHRKNNRYVGFHDTPYDPRPPY